MVKDESESINLYTEKPEIVKALAEKLEKVKTTPLTDLKE